MKKETNLFDLIVSIAEVFGKALEDAQNEYENSCKCNENTECSCEEESNCCNNCECDCDCDCECYRPYWKNDFDLSFTDDITEKQYDTLDKITDEFIGELSVNSDRDMLDIEEDYLKDVLMEFGAYVINR